MALIANYRTRVLFSDSSIPDAVSFHEELRLIESSIEGRTKPDIHSYRQISIGGGAIFPSVKAENGWSLQFPNSGSFQISGGNIDFPVIPTGSHIDHIQASAYAVTSSGGVGLSQEDLNAIAAIVASQLATMDGSLTPEQNNQLMKKLATKIDIAANL